MSLSPAELLERSFTRTTRMNLYVGLGILAMGLFMMALHIFELDSETRDMGTGGLVALYLFALLFVGLGAGFMWVGLIKTPRDARQLRALITDSPQEIKKFWRFTTTRTGADGVGAQNFIKLQITSDKVHQFSVKKEDIEPLLQYLAAQAPEAELGDIEVQQLHP